ncbi:uncharacterized protein LOC144882703 [Branchiostoma floridae x Branchiostoma japonicum]
METDITCQVIDPNNVTLPLKDGEMLVSDVIELGPHGTTFHQPVTVQMQYSSMSSGGDTEAVMWVTEDRSQWTELTAIKKIENQLSVSVDHFSIFAVISQPKQDQFTVSTEGRTLTSSTQPAVQIKFPKGSVNTETQVTIQVQQVPKQAVDDIKAKDQSFSHLISTSPIVKVETVSDSEVQFHNPVTVRVPHPQHYMDIHHEGGTKLRVMSCEEGTEDWVDLRGPRMQQLYSQACRQGARPVHNTRGLVVGQFRSGKTCVVRRLTGEKAVEDEPITDGIEISPSVMTKTWRKAKGRGEDEDRATSSGQPQHQRRLQDDVTVQKTQDIPDDVMPKVKQQLPSGVAVQQQTRDIPNDVIMKAKERLQRGVAEEQLGTAEHPRLSIWDFGGQATYYGSHQSFFTYRGIYILVMSLLQKLSNPVPDLDYKASADNLVTGRDYLDHWLNSVHTHTLVHGQEHTGQPPVVLVLTHKDMVSESEIEEYKKDILDHISGKAAGKHVLPKIFVVDNFDEDNSDIDELREYLREVAQDQWYMGQEVPITWLHLKSKLMDKRREGDPFCSLQDAVDLARSDDVGITDDSHVADILTFLHDLGDIIFVDEPALRDHVALRPQVMIDVFKTIITVPEYQQDRSTDADVAEMWSRLEKEGILSDTLLTIIWTKADQTMQKPFLLRNKTFLKRLMEKYYLICNATPIGGFDDTMRRPEKEEIYFVPSLLAAKPDDNTLYPGHMRRYRYPLYVVFDNMFLPSGMFYRLQAICVRRFGLAESCVFAGCGRFPTDDETQQFVVTKVKHYLKVELLSSEAEDQAVFTQGLPVRKFLSSCLFEIKEKWIPSIQYDWCFGEESDEGSSIPSFHPLSEIGQETATPSRFPEDFIWMGREQTATRLENSGGDGPATTEHTLSPADISAVHTIGPVLDCMETCGGLSLPECDQIRHELTFVSRFKELVAAVDKAGKKCLLGASVEVCLPDMAPMFPREERGNDIVVLHVRDNNDKLVQPLMDQIVQSSSRYGVTVREDVIKPEEVITDKLLDYLLNQNFRMVVPIITPQALHSQHWSALGYEFSVQNKNLVFPVFAYPEGTRERLLEVLGRRCAGMLDMSSIEAPLTEEPLSSTKVGLITAEILRKASSSVVLNTYKITPEGCTLEEDGVTISFPKGCVKTERSLSLEVEMLPIDDALTTAFSAVTPVLTVHQEQEEDFLQPVRVTLPWAWRKSGCGADKTVLMERKSHPRHWSLLRVDFEESEDTVTFATRHFCGIAGAKESGNDGESSISTGEVPENQDEAANEEAAEESIFIQPGNQDKPANQVVAEEMEAKVASTVATEAFQGCCKRYTEDKVYLIINPNQATMDNNYIHLMCVHKDDSPTDFFRAANMHTLPPFQQRIVMGREERIDATFDDSREVIGDPRDVSDGINFYFPPEDCNRCSVGLILKPPYEAKKMYNGAVHFSRHHAESGKQVTHDPRRRIRSATVFLHIDEARAAPPPNGSEDHGGRSAAHATHRTAPRGGNADVHMRNQGPTVLLISDEYGTFKGGVSTINSQVGQILTNANAVVYCTVLRVPKQDQEAADRHGVTLIPPVHLDEESVPTLNWLTLYHIVHYPDLPPDVTCIIGHADITDTAARNIWEQRYPQADLMTFNHAIPEDTEYYQGGRRAMTAWEKEKGMLDKVNNAKAAFSLGQWTYDHFDTMYKGEKKPQSHYVFLPKPSEIFLATTVRPGGQQKVVLSIGRVRDVEKLKGHDLVAQSMGEVLKEVKNARLRVRGISEDDWETSKKILEDNLKSPDLNPTLLPYGTQEDIRDDMMTAHLVLMPSRSEPFGLIGLEAIAAGIPVLISDKTGLAGMIKDLIKQEKIDAEHRHIIVETSVNNADAGGDAKRWAERIVDILNHSKSAFKQAARLKKELEESRYWEESHRTFLQACGVTTGETGQ